MFNDCTDPDLVILPQLPFKVKVVVATGLPADRFATDTLTGQSITAWQWGGVEVHLHPENNTNTLGHHFNRVIERSLDDDCMMVFIHDDVLLVDWYWPYRLYDAIQKFNIVGMAGSTRRWPNQGAWGFLGFDENGQRVGIPDTTVASGFVAHGETAWPPNRGFAYFGHPEQPVVLMDGLLLATHSSVFRTGLRFDPQFGYHMFDLDFCRSAEKLGLTMGTAALAVMHRGLGTGYGSDEYWADYEKYCAKWQEPNPYKRV